MRRRVPASAAMALALLMAGCFGGPDESNLSTAAAVDPVKAEEARRGEEALAKKNREAEARFLRKVASPEAE